MEHMPKLDYSYFWPYKEQFQLAADRYDNWVMFAVESGAFRYRIDIHEGIAEAGDLILCPPHSTFHREVTAAVTFHFLAFQYVGQEPLPAGRVRLQKERRRLWDNLAQLREAARDTSALGLQIRSHLLADLWLLIRRERAALPQAASPIAIVDDPVIAEVREYLTEHALKPLMLKDIADRFHLSPVQCSRRFHRAFQMKPLAYITELRLKHACRLLTETDWTIDAIASACGYENGFYLSRLFTREIGKNPSTYRSLYRL
ncbi:AraC family transcriptional regulator [Paenibacillus sp. J5C_2022]|uniref:helix-turn-helix domain-containing protein n=1 Tax=Paenibacillus sp. J5C2022 TaxID=2977129 RepID=UPI0021D2C420|nr:AraC family transcriptional regulator [Paenibacillus sp. J5C2022]MCU6709609.1 AraC family transcriptional regulator [Paenibacillus sp. J5C2022]